MSNQVVLETERLVLTNWLPEQAADLARLHGKNEVTRYLSGDGDPWSKERVTATLARWENDFETRRMGKLRLIRKSDGVFVGRAGFGIYDETDEPEIGYALFPKHQGQGYAFEAACGLRDWLFRETSEPHFIGLADVRNMPSLKVLHNIGMRVTHIAQEPSGLTAQYHIYTRQDWQAAGHGR